MDQPISSLDSDLERHVARLVVVLYYCGEPLNSLIEGEFRQVESRARLGRFDFWVREPGHLALALLDAAPRLNGDLPALRQVVDRMLVDDQVDIRRVALPGADSYNGDLDYMLSFLSSRAVISDRPSFSKTGSHQIVLEAPGIALAEQIFTSCPTFAWYRMQSEIVKRFFPVLEHYDLAAMPYLKPDLTPMVAASISLIPYIRERYDRILSA
jgi:hypothetical protein